MKIGTFEVEFGCDPMGGGNFLNINMPDGRILTIWSNANEPEIVGGTSVFEVWPNQEAVDEANCHVPGYKMIGF